MTARRAPPLARWLEDNGLGSHAAAFGDTPADAATLAELGDADLVALGLGRAERLRFRRAVSQRLISEAAADVMPIVPSCPPGGRR